MNFSVSFSCIVRSTGPEDMAAVASRDKDLLNKAERTAVRPNIDRYATTPRRHEWILVCNSSGLNIAQALNEQHYKAV